MLDAYALHFLPLAGVEPVHVPVDVVEADVLVEVRLQVLNCRHLAQWLAHPGDDQMPEYVVTYGSETDAVVYAVQDDLRGVVERPVNVREHLPGRHDGLVALVEIESQLAGVLVHPCTGPALQLLDLMRIRRHTDGLELTELPRTLVHHDHADRARFVSAPADKHARKGSQSEAIHPEKFPIL